MFMNTSEFSTEALGQGFTISKVRKKDLGVNSRGGESGWRQLRMPRRIQHASQNCHLDLLVTSTWPCTRTSARGKFLREERTMEAWPGSCSYCLTASSAKCWCQGNAVKGKIPTGHAATSCLCLPIGRIPLFTGLSEHLREFSQGEQARNNSDPSTSQGQRF